MILEFLKYLEHLQRCSSCDPAQYNWMKKSQYMLVWLRKMVLGQHNCTDCSGWLIMDAATEKSVINVI
jgi:hypothetical protein